MVFNLSYQTNCLNVSQAWTDPNETTKRDHVLRIYHGWLNLPATLIALPLTLLFMAASIRAIKSHRVSRKFHVLLVNRAIGDLATSIVSLIICFYMFLTEHVNIHWLQLLNTFFTACFWSGLVTYTSIGFLKLYGIARPLKYKDKVTIKKCLLLIKLSWVFFLLIVAATMGFTLLVKIQILAEWTGCKAESCLSWMYKIRNIFTLSLYLATLAFFVVSVLLIRKAKRHSASLHAGAADRQQRSVRKRFKFPLIKLTLGVSTFAIFHLPYAIFMMFLMVANGCYFLLHYNLMQSLLGIIRFFVLIRIILDNILGLVMDQEIRRQLLALFSFRPIRIGQSGKTSSTKRIGGKLSMTTNSVVISSESAPDSFEKIEEANHQKGEANDDGNTRSQKRTESAKMSPKGIQKKLQPKRHSERTEHKKSVKF